MSAQKRDLKHITVHMIGNAHIDPVWQWRWEEGRQEVLDTCHAALDRINDTPGFIFCESAAVTYHWIEQEDPELFAAIKQAIADGRWVIVNGWWLQPDCNIPSGESLVRHGLIGQRYFLSRFGVAAKTGWNVDTFGHAWQIPQILRGQGMDGYCFFRPGQHEKQLPTLFWWEAPDGSRVLAANMPGHYGSWGKELIDRIHQAAELAPPGLSDTMNFYGVGNHGGGPTLENIASIKKVDRSRSGPHAVFSSPDLFFDKVRDEAEFPVVAEELQYHSRGCYTAVSAIKQHNRRAENLLLAAEKMSVLANRLLGIDYPACDFDCAWKRVLFNQFHDIMAGTSIRPACDDAVADYEEAEMLAERAIRNVLARVSAQIDCAGEGRPIVVYNTLSWRRTEVIAAEVAWYNHDDQVHIVDEKGKPVPCQVVHTNISGRGTTVRVLFLAEVPACGYRAYRMVQGAGPAWPNEFQVGHDFVESAFYRLEFDHETGHLTRLLDKRHDRDLLAAPGNVPLVIDDQSDTWSHDVLGFRDVIGAFEATHLEVVEVGPVRARIVVQMESGEGTMLQDIRLYRDVPRIDIEATIDYHGEHEFLKIAFPTLVADPVATGEGPYGFAVREANGNEEPAQKWCDVSGAFADGRVGGLAILNDAKYGYDCLGGELRLSVLRTPIYCFHNPSVVDPRLRYEFTDQGLQRFTYSLLPHDGDWREGDVVRQAQQLNQPCIVREEPAHKGKLRPVFSMAEVDAENVIVEVVKQAEEGDGLAVRMYETRGLETTAKLTLRLPATKSAELTFRPYEIKTVLFADGKIVEADMLERLL